MKTGSYAVVCTIEDEFSVQPIRYPTDEVIKITKVNKEVVHGYGKIKVYSAEGTDMKYHQYELCSIAQATKVLKEDLKEIQRILNHYKQYQQTIGENK